MISMKRGAQDAVAAIAIDREARRLQREADAALVEAAGCSRLAGCPLQAISAAP